MFGEKDFSLKFQGLFAGTPPAVGLFSLHKYNSPMDYSDNTLAQVVVLEKSFVEFFHNVKALFRAQQDMLQ